MDIADFMTFNKRGKNASKAGDIFKFKKIKVNYKQTEILPNGQNFKACLDASNNVIDGQ